LAPDESNTVWSAIKSAIVDVFRGKDQLEAVEKQEFRPYSTLEIDLGTARTNAEFRYKGDLFSVMRNDGMAHIRFNEKDNDEFDLSIIDWCRVPYYRFFITNTAQSGKRLKMAFGQARAFMPHTAPSMMSSIKDGSVVSTSSLAATTTATSNLIMNNDAGLHSKQILVRGMAVQIAETGDAASYVAVEYYDGTNFVEIKRNTGTEPKLEWNGAPHLDRGYVSGANLISRFRFKYYNAGVAAKAQKEMWNFEKVS